MNLRTATSADLEALAALYRRPSLHWDDDRPWLLAHPQHLLWDGAGLAEGRTRLAEQRGGVLGFSTWFPEVEDALEVVDLFVDPPAMGLGVGRALVEDLVAVARELGVAALEVTGNPNALGFYTRVGFVVVGERPTERVPGARLRLEVRSADRR